MSKELREMLQVLADKKAEVRALLGENKVAEAEKMMDEVRALQKKVDIQMELEAADDPTFNDGNPVNSRTDAELEGEYKRVFLRGLRRQRISADDRSIINEYYSSIRAAMHEGGVDTDTDGDVSIIVPQDIQTSINRIMRTLNDLSQYVRIETVNTLSGSRVLEKDEDMTPFTVVEEYGTIGEMDNPRFIPVTYKLVKRAGILPLTNELLRDSDQNVLNYVANWIAKKHVVTKNSLIIAILNGMTPKELPDLKAVKKVINVDLDPALVTAGGIVLTNQDGFNWLDEQVDENGRFLLQDDITQPGRKLFKGLPIGVVANRYWPSSNVESTIKAPITIGNLENLIVLFTRGQYELTSTREGGDAFKRDTTDLRTITRDDCKQWDTGAAVAGLLTLS